MDEEYNLTAVYKPVKKKNGKIIREYPYQLSDTNFYKT